MRSLPTPAGSPPGFCLLLSAISIAAAIVAGVGTPFRGHDGAGRSRRRPWRHRGAREGGPGLGDQEIAACAFSPLYGLSSMDSRARARDAGPHQAGAKTSYVLMNCSPRDGTNVAGVTAHTNDRHANSACCALNAKPGRSMAKKKAAQFELE